MQWVSALSKKTDIDAAVQEASEEIVQQLGKDQADLTVIFVAPQYRDFYAKVPDLVNRYLKPGMLFGCSGGGIIGNGVEVEQQAALSITCAKMPGVKIQPIYSETRELPNQDTSPSVWREWLNVNNEDQPHFVFLAVCRIKLFTRIR